ncbi:hypothetical protein VTK73DRAFT_1112 [Phialemonium thermophilum]|uniref:alpha-1,2-Mannosidase n=1 Tax=Phialemonium thermophilum TaxID=223376 RepID=A0ABR3XAX6_9PEZI
MHCSGLLGVLAMVWQVTAGPLPQDGSAPVERRYAANKTRTDAVKSAFQTAWDGYYKYAFPHDSLTPVNNGYSDDRNGWGASAIDAFSTALVMENWEVVNQILKFVPTINFDNTTSEISLFETTIRYLGGLLSAYDLLTGPLKTQAQVEEDSVQAILKQAKRLADNLSFAFSTPSGVPDNIIYFNPSRRANSTRNGLATIGTLVLEWTRLSDLTGSDIYGALAQRGETYLLDPKPALGEPFPGLLGTNVDIKTGQFLDGSGGWVGGDDSFYEYLIKMYQYDPKRFGKYKDRWLTAVNSTIEHLASTSSGKEGLTFLAMFSNTTLRYVSQHLACFDGGNIILGGLLLNDKRYVDFGLDLVYSCHETYTATATGIGPEVFAWQDRDAPSNAANNPPPPSDQADFYERAGFWITSGAYVLRPEVIESYYYAYRATGDPKYQEWAWDAFVNINRTCRVGSGYSSINDVNKPDGGGFSNFQESFWFAEVLKYSYLIHAEEADWQIQPDNSQKFVFNTEAHPVRLAAANYT